MVLRNILTIIKATFLFITIAIFFSCEDPGAIVINCSDCISDEPVTARLQIKLEDLNYELAINIYLGNIEDSILYESFTTSAGVTYRTVLLNRKYTLTASYDMRGNTYIVVNSVTPHVLYDEDDCEEPCYFVYNKDVDLRLKYTKYGGK